MGHGQVCRAYLLNEVGGPSGLPLHEETFFRRHRDLATRARSSDLSLEGRDSAPPPFLDDLALAPLETASVLTWKGTASKSG